MLNSAQLSHHARQALETTRSLIERFGGRLAGSEACRQAALCLQDEFSRICGPAQVRLEAFTTRPGAFTGFYRIDILLYCVGLVLLWLGQPLPAALLLVWMVFAAGLQFGYYVELYDRFYPRKTCYNVVAALEPQQPARRQVILSAHHDSAQELRFLKSSQKLYALKIVVPDFFRIMAGVFAIYWAAYRVFVSGAGPAAAPPVTPWMLGLLSTVGLYFVFTKFSLFSREAVPGAGDNLIASAMLLELARLFADPANPGHSTLRDTRLVLVSFDAEEAGLRGARAFVRAHRAELAALPTLNLNIDSIYKVEDLQFLTSDLNSHVRLDRALAEDCVQIACAGGYPARLAVMRFGGGGTDAAELARAGVRAITMIAMHAGIVRDGLVYHTMQDTVDSIEPRAVEACLHVAASWLLKTQ